MNPTIYLTLSDGPMHLAIDGHIELLRRFLMTFSPEEVRGNYQKLEPHAPITRDPATNPLPQKGEAVTT